jgi:peptide/nickel transport system ATP-binding protein
VNSVESTPPTRAASSADDVRPPTLVRVEGLKVHFPIRSGLVLGRQVGAVKAVDGVDLDIPEGRTLGLVGESGCGKSTLGKAMLRLAPVTAGKVVYDGTDVASLKGEELRKMRRHMQMVFQDPLASLNPRQSVETILTEPLKAHGITYDKANRVRELLDQVGLPGSASAKYPHEFSGGQRQRIGIARAIALEPRFVIADEPVSALDVSIQAQVLNLLEELQQRLGLTYLVIAHDLAVVRHVSDEVAVMYLGGVVEQASSDDLYATPRHPYTKALMSAVPVPDPKVEARRQRIVLAGDLPSPADPPTGCRFHTRCPFRQETRCDDERPQLRLLAPGHQVACHWAEDIEAGLITPREITDQEVADAQSRSRRQPSRPPAGPTTGGQVSVAGAATGASAGSGGG